ncbi:sulfotransferase [Marmoricola endophyticus]|uniref:Sulfotransferase n=1 Tax=Marmoricola endophyticus TaxID=2040280 RepID=A0A917F1K7_9ACTN|nr:sulfotransferase [Marmoricola endophyticus]GGF43631.1 sulfotransferase [Marmoricola endophyticus]
MTAATDRPVLREQSPTDARPTVLYVAGSGRSGSTALAQVLERELAAGHAGEVRYLWDRGIGEDQLCQCGQPFSRCPWWSGVLSRAHGEALDGAAGTLARVRPAVDRIRRVPSLLRQARAGQPTAAVAAYADVVVPVYAALAAHGARDEAVIDSSKDPSYLFALAATGRIDLRVLHLVRDSRAVAHSWTRRKRRPEIHWEEQYMRTLPPWRSAVLWTEYNTVLETARGLGVPVLRVRYEDFATDPDATVGRVATSLGLARRQLGTAPAGHSFSGNPIRFDAEPVRVRLDEAWRTALAADQRRRVTALTAPLLASYGYLGRTRGGR